MSMFKLESSVLIDAPVEKVWEFLSDLEQRPQWDTDIREVECKGAVGIGTTAVATAQLIGRRTFKVTITDWQPNHKLGTHFKLLGTTVDEVMSIEPLDGTKTRLTRSIEAEIGGALKLLWPFMLSRVKKAFAEDVDRFKSVVEARSTVLA